jgi:hypothetical protein
MDSDKEVIFDRAISSLLKWKRINNFKKKKNRHIKKNSCFFHKNITRYSLNSKKKILCNTKNKIIKKKVILNFGDSEYILNNLRKIILSLNEIGFIKNFFKKIYSTKLFENMKLLFFIMKLYSIVKF